MVVEPLARGWQNILLKFMGSFVTVYFQNIVAEPGLGKLQHGYYKLVNMHGYYKLDIFSASPLSSPRSKAPVVGLHRKLRASFTLYFL